MKLNSHRPVPSEKPCRYFSNSSGCRFGQNCRYRHHETPGDCEGNAVKSSANVNVENAASFTTNNTLISENAICENTTGNINAPLHTVVERSAAQSGETVKIEKEKSQGKRTLCRFFMKGYCRDAAKCRFLHPWKVRKSTGKSKNGGVDDDGGGGDGGGGGQDRNIEIAGHAKPVPVSKPKNVGNCLSDLSDEDMKYLQNIEIEQIQKRFGKDVDVIGEQGSDVFYKITVKPSDPDWPYDVTEVPLSVHFPSDYPKKIFKVEICDDGQFPDGFTNTINHAVGQHLKEHETAQQLRNTADLLFRPFLRWLDRNLEDLFTKALKQIKFDVEAHSAGFEFIPFVRNTENATTSAKKTEDNVGIEELKIQDDEGNVAALRSDATTEGNTTDPEGAPGDPAQSIGGPTGEPSIMFGMVDTKRSSAKKGTEVRFRGLELHENTATVRLTSLTFTVVCSRCKNREELPNVKENTRVLLTCQKCSNAFSIVMTSSEFVHQHSSTVAFINPRGCLPLDLVLTNCVVLLGCLNCDKETSVKGLHYGATKNVWCHHCHQKLDMKIDSTRFYQLQHDDATDKNVLTVQVQQKKRVKDPPIKSGEPLPDNGTCKHYKKSYRWMRFPCCGKCYPCDECHKENEEHEMELATRMICGFCAKEQAFSQKGCVSCKSFVTAVHTSHWEGGKGCRSKIKMSRGDNKKHSDTDKTVSRHAAKVHNKKKS